MTYQAPVQTILLAMRTAGRLGSAIYADLHQDDAAAILEEAGRFAAAKIAPLNRVGDTQGASLSGGRVRTPDGWKEAYHDWRAAGWSALSGSKEYGGQGLPMIMASACTEVWNAASIGFAVNMLLTTGAIEAINAHASEELKSRYLPNMISGVWTGTMNLTEPQSGSDLSGLRCRAERAGDGTYRISGSKIFITYGEHDWAENIIHLVLARLPDAPAGTRGISLFLVPKVLPGGDMNDLRCHSIEHKLGLRGSPTCTMVYGDRNGAVGWLIGEENRGLNCMFTMMNNARLLVGVQGVGLADRATQAAFAFAQERRQGRALGIKDGQSCIVEHPDVRRMLLEMQSKTLAARLLCMATASAIDESARGTDDSAKDEAQARASLLTPLAKSYATDIATEVASLGVQVHGGMGYIEETGVAQFYRDARILPIYEGTNGIQAIDLVTRKLQLRDGAVLRDELARCETSVARWRDHLGPNDLQGSFLRAIQGVLQAANWIGSSAPETALAAAHPFQRALAAVVAAGYMVDALVESQNRTMQHHISACCSYFIAAEVAHVAAVREELETKAAAIAGFQTTTA